MVVAGVRNRCIPPRREAIEWDKILDTVNAAVVIETSPLGVERLAALALSGSRTTADGSLDGAPVIPEVGFRAHRA